MEYQLAYREDTKYIVELTYDSYFGALGVIVLEASTGWPVHSVGLDASQTGSGKLALDVFAHPFAYGDFANE